ncbi:MAG: Acyl-CoA dehydrogenase [Syntrophorhabdus sp. PtaU1.Bin058]|nr:MAG: Acyl-CoA dehydrogenase [Syntrophorhabdus sp. PtaU1.Bin058]
MGGGSFENCIVVEELSTACLGVSVSYAASLLGAYPILLGGSEAQKKKYLPEIASGRRLGAFALTEANAGSDAQGIRTEATKAGNDHYILNGTKQWITNGGEADIYTVVAMTDRKKGGRGATAFIVEKGMEGFSFGKKENKLGIRASATRELVFQDCKVPVENVIGREGMGFILAMRTFDRTRPGIGAQAVGLAQGALDAAVHYAREREQFEKKIISFQAIQHMLADMAIQVEAARALVYAVARYIDSNPRDFSKVSAISKVFPSDVAMKVVVDALQVFGGYGYMKEYPIEKMMRDAKILQIYEGTNQIQRNVIALELIKEAASKRRS